MTKDEIIAALVKATGPSRELEVEIFTISGHVNEAHCKEWCRQDGRTDLTRERYIAAWAPNYTASIDAALTLVPEGFAWMIAHSNKENVARARCNLASIRLDHVSQIGEPAGRAEAATPAIALCIAALRARP